MWTAEDSSIASVVDGLVTANKVGQTTVTVSAGEYSKKCYVTVIPDQEVPVLSVVNAHNGVINLNVDDEYNLKFTVSFAGEHVEAQVSFTSSDEQVVAVDGNGKITATGIGEAQIFIGGEWREFGETLINTTVRVIVKEKVSFSLYANQSSIYAVQTLDGETFVRQTEVVPSLTIDNVSHTTGFTFESTDSSVASVDGNGVVVGKKVGKIPLYIYTYIMYIQQEETVK
jgi:hypothetical protein